LVAAPPKKEEDGFSVETGEPGLGSKERKLEIEKLSAKPYGKEKEIIEGRCAVGIPALRCDFKLHTIPLRKEGRNSWPNAPPLPKKSRPALASQMAESACL